MDGWYREDYNYVQIDIIVCSVGTIPPWVYEELPLLTTFQVIGNDFDECVPISKYRQLGSVISYACLLQITQSVIIVLLVIINERFKVLFLTL